MRHRARRNQARKARGRRSDSRGDPWLALGLLQAGSNSGAPSAAGRRSGQAFPRLVRRSGLRRVQSAAPSEERPRLSARTAFASGRALRSVRARVLQLARGGSWPRVGNIPACMEIAAASDGRLRGIPAQGSALDSPAPDAAHEALSLNLERIQLRFRHILRSRCSLRIRRV